MTASNILIRRSAVHASPCFFVPDPGVGLAFFEGDVMGVVGSGSDELDRFIEVGMVVE
jgi:hypothetical protein